jgi:diguanylate cyclase (GGDEF)-like protein
MLLELAHLARVNAERGTEAGDAMMREAAERIRSAAPQNSCLGRLRGPRFLLVFEHLAAAEADEICSRIAGRLAAQPLPFRQHMLSLEGHAGLAFHSTPSESDQALCERADQALGRAKSSLPGTFRRAI